MKLLKTLENQNSLPNEEVVEAKYFYEILNNKMHKTFSKALKQKKAPPVKVEKESSGNSSG